MSVQRPELGVILDYEELDIYDRFAADDVAYAEPITREFDEVVRANREEHGGWYHRVARLELARREALS